jgi:hypothetical protein
MIDYILFFLIAGPIVFLIWFCETRKRYQQINLVLFVTFTLFVICFSAYLEYQTIALGLPLQTSTSLWIHSFLIGMPVLFSYGCFKYYKNSFTRKNTETRDTPNPTVGNR